MRKNSIFNGRTLLIATKHGKESVITPILESGIGVICKVPEGIDTDVLGTFSGEVERRDDALVTAGKKCDLAYSSSSFDLILASEGSFIPHPYIPFITVNEEILLLKDYKNKLEITAKSLSTDTNYFEHEIQSFAELESFAEKVKFPSHGIILSERRDKPESIFKGLHREDALMRAYDFLKHKYGMVYAQTDMRAFHNPLRMQAIEKTAHRLVTKASSVCPVCGTPGFAETEYVSGLPCSQCNFPTNSVLAHILSCLKCNHTERILCPNGKEYEDAMYCDYCNP
jgi:hypothetical protein